MARVFLTDDQVELEIERLNASPLVALARKEERVRNRRRQYMYKLRDLEKKGLELAHAGMTVELLDVLDSDVPDGYTAADFRNQFTRAQREAISKALDNPKKLAAVCKLLGVSAE